VHNAVAHGRGLRYAVSVYFHQAVDQGISFSYCLEGKTANMDQLPQNHPVVSTGRTGVLLINLGTPEATDYWSIRRYLSEFLSDRRVVEMNPLKWQLILQGIILTTRPVKSGAAYDKIWNRENEESPLKTVTREQSELVAKAFSQRKSVVVDWAMRYGKPAIAERLQGLKDQGCDRVLLCPLYPQYSASTTASANDKAFDVLKSMRWQPAIRTLPPYFGHPAYIDALAATLKAHLKKLAGPPDLVLASFHGLPQEFLDKGDPYHCHCHKTARLLREKLAWGHDKLRLTFQSRFGRKAWLKPYTDETLARLAKEGVKHLVVITPGFSADCIETLEEIAIAGRRIFMDHGGQQFSLVPCLNASKPGVTMLKSLVSQELQGWL
jgi:protoporphyrin/coproporphyrin ferrochelatase